ncbi:putative gamma-glutamylcyclotransferase CG2811 [Daphnia magna]|uniref:Gamma-glutamylcyclotransferase family protein n=1 Tax=Daphnia magna TaxID=35525 RepID=A0A0P5ZL53_9CRUS|nr:putative gamma-glutamylcyclotransferase CG2811 [Daphnia magna]KAK4036250.1 hypothetical protein OUZ56_028313 [Daphnia magna]
MDQSYTVFVYGTLKRNQPNHHYLSSAKFITEATCFEKFPLVIASKYNIPFAINKPGSGFRIKGELFTVDEETLAKLDELENHPTLYVRQLQSFETTDGKIVEAWVYLLQEYKPEMLELEFFESYFSEGKHGKQYVASDDDLTKPEDILQVLRIK